MTVGGRDVRSVLAQLVAETASRDVEKLAFINPLLLTHHTRDALRSVVGRDRTVERTVVEELDRIAARVEADPSTWRIGVGPVEGLMVGIGLEHTEEEACEEARRGAEYFGLSMPYVQVLCSQALWTTLREDRRRGLSYARLIAAAVAALPAVTEERDLMTWIAATHLARAAVEVFGEIGDVAVQQEGLQATATALGLGAAAGDPDMIGYAQYLTGLLHVAPFRLWNPLEYPATLRRWIERATEERLRLKMEEVPKAWPPPPEQLLQTAEHHLRLALAIPNFRFAGEAALALLDTLRWQQRLGRAVDENECLELMRRALEFVSSENIPERLHAVLHARPLLPSDTFLRYVEQVRDISPLDLVRFGRRQAAAMVADLLDAFANEPTALEAARRYRPLIETLDGEARKLATAAEAALLYVPALRALAETGLPPEALDSTALEREGRSNRRSDLQRAQFLAAAAMWSADESRSRLDLLDEAMSIDADLAAHHETAFHYLRGEALVAVAARAYHEGDIARCVRHRADAALEFLDAGVAERALECLNVLILTIEEPVMAVTRGVVEALVPSAARLEGLPNAAGGDLLRLVLREALGTEVEGPTDADTVLACFQLAKAARFGAVLRSDTRYSFSEDTKARRLLDYLGHVTARADRVEWSPEARGGVNELLLVRPFEVELDRGNDIVPLDRVENMQRSLERHVQDELLRSADTLAFVSKEELRRSLDDETVFWSITPCTVQDDFALVSLLATDEETVVVRHPTDPTLSTIVTVGTENGLRVREFDLSVAELRRGVVADPGPDMVMSHVGDALDRFLVDRLGPAAERLDDLWAQGKRHLVVHPWGALHFLPFHLLGPADAPLGSRWTVTSVPSLLYATPTPPRPRRDGPDVIALGLSFAGGTAHGLAPLRGAVPEATAVAAAFGLTPLVDEAATEAAFVDALQTARRVHVATHGRQHAAAPSFQELYLAPSGDSDGALPAYQLLDLDLSGLELVTLSACETALGRVDDADNLRGVAASLLLRGARTVIGTLWPVADRVAGAFFSDLYGRLAEGASSLEAFAAAQHVTRTTFPRHRDWGAFSFTGHWQDGPR